MSAFSNTNYQPAAQSGQMNLVNGIAPPVSKTQQQQLSQQYGQQAMPTTQQQLFQQQQQQILQKKQQQQQLQQVQQHSNMPQFNSSTMSKFMPPMSSATINTNGPSRTAEATPSTMPPNVSNLPPHLRPPGVNSLAGGLLTNGGGGGGGDGSSAVSANSSRTASPALHIMPPTAQFQQTQQQQRSFTSAVPTMAPTSTSTQSLAKFTPPPLTSSTNNSVDFTSSMQNLNLARANGVNVATTIASQQQQMPPSSDTTAQTNLLQQQLIQQRQQQQQVQRQTDAQQQQQQQPQMQRTQNAPTNFENNFKTHALNTAAGPIRASPVSTPQSSMPNSLSNPSISSSSGFTPSPIQADGPVLPAGLQAQTTSTYGTSTSPLMSSQPFGEQQSQPQGQQQHSKMPLLLSRGANYPPSAGSSLSTQQSQQQQQSKVPPSHANQNSNYPPNSTSAFLPQTSGLQQQQKEIAPSLGQNVNYPQTSTTSGFSSQLPAQQQQPKMPPLPTNQNANYAPITTSGVTQQAAGIQQQQQPKMPAPASQNSNYPPSTTNNFSLQSPVQQQQQQPKMPPPPTTNQNANYPPSSTNIFPPQVAGQQTKVLPPPPSFQNSNYPTSNTTTTNLTQQPPLTSTTQQNRLNNNQQQQSILPPPTHQVQSPQQQFQLSAQRKPMYPTTNNLPQMQQQQQSQLQSNYTPAYQQQQQQQQPPTLQPQPPPPTQSGLFNGQPNRGPLQYQQQPQLLQQQQMYQQQQQMQPPFSGAPTQYQQPGGVLQQGYNRLWGQDTIDLMQNRHILTPATLQPPKIVLNNQFHESINCNRNIMRCTIAKIPESNSLLQKSRLPLGILIHPFRDINSLPVIQCPNIVRCRLCRTYINPFVYFVDSKMWKCNLCYRVNELPDDFQFDPATKTYGDVTRRPEVRSSTIEFIAPSEYMLRPPQPAIYLFLFDVSIIAQQSGYLENVCATLSQHLDDMPGDIRTQIGFIAYNSQVHFYGLAEGYNQPHEMTLIDIDEPFLPRPDNLLVNLKECKDLIKDLLALLPKRFADTHDPGSALGSALQIAYKMMVNSGGRVTVFQTCLPNKGPGSLESREDPNFRSAKDVAHLNPATDFYKRFALECSGYQIAVDLFLLNQQYSDLATISGISKHSGGCVHHFPLYQKTKVHHVDVLKQCFKRYLVRKIGFEAVMRIRCTRGLQVHTFHGNFFVRSTDLLSLPNVNPDAGYGMQISYEENLSDVKTICFQAALLYTNSEGERRIRVHTLCLPVTASLPEVMHAADTEAIVSLLSKMAVDRSLSSNMADAREAFINATVDVLSAFKIAQNLPAGQSGQLIAPKSLSLLPLYILALLKHPAFRVGTSTRLDDRVYAMDCMKTLPLDQLMRFIYPEFYNIDALFYNVQNSNTKPTDDDDDDDDMPDLPRLQLSAEYLDSRSIFLMDCGTIILIYVGLNVPMNILENAFGVKSTAEMPDYVYGLPNVNAAENEMLKRFIMKLNDDKPYTPIVQIIRDTSTAKPQFIEKLVDDRSESSLSYYEFIQHIRTQVK